MKPSPPVHIEQRALLQLPLTLPFPILPFPAGVKFGSYLQHAPKASRVGVNNRYERKKVSRYGHDSLVCAQPLLLCLDLADFIVESYVPGVVHARPRTGVYSNQKWFENPPPSGKPPSGLFLGVFFSPLARYLQQSYVRHYGCDVTPRSYIQF